MNSITQSASPQVRSDFAVKIANLKVECENYMVGCDWTELLNEVCVACYNNLSCTLYTDTFGQLPVCHSGV